jgi:hypothetical protein
MNELCGEFLDDGGEGVWRGKVVYALCECGEDGGHAELVIGEVFEDVGVEGENGELVSAHDTGEELHEEDLVVEGKALVVAGEVVVEFLGKGLGVVEELEGREVGGGGLGRAVLFLWTGSCGWAETMLGGRTFLATLSRFWSFLSALRVFLLISRR